MFFGQFRYLVPLEQEGRFGRAVVRCNVSQPTLPGMRAGRSAGPPPAATVDPPVAWQVRRAWRRRCAAGATTRRRHDAAG